MAEREHPDDLNMVDSTEWAADNDELDREFAQDDCVEVNFDDDEAPEESDTEDQMLNGECGAIGEDDLYDGNCAGAMEDDARCHVKHSDSVLSVGFHPEDQRCLVTGGQDDVAVLWNLNEENGALHCVERCRLSGHTDSVTQVAFSADGKYVATGGYDGIVKIWLPETGELVHTLDGPSKEIEWILWHPKGHAILAGSADAMAWMWWAPSGKLMQIFAGHAQTVTCGAWGLGGKLIITGSSDRSVIVWNPRAGTPQQHVREVHEEGVVSMCAHSEAPLVVSGSEDGSAKVIQMEAGKIVADLPGHEASVEALGWNHPGPDGISLLVTGSMDGKLMVWDGKTFDLRCTMKDESGLAGIVRFKWLPAPVYGSWLCACCTDGALRLFNALSGQCMQVFRGHSETAVDIDVVLMEGGNGQQLGIASGSEDKTCRIFTCTLSSGNVVLPTPETDKLA